MPKLARNMYTTSKGERKVNCYVCAIPKEVVRKAGIEDDEQIVVYEWYGDIVIKKRWHCTCMECGFEWDSGKDYDIQTICPHCMVGDIHYDENGELYDYQKQRIKEDA